MLHLIATGHPAIPTGDFDFTPLLYFALLLFILLRQTLVPVRLWMLPIVLVVGAMVDTISDGMGLSTLTTSLALVAVALVVSWHRTQPRPRRSPDV